MQVFSPYGGNGDHITQLPGLMFQFLFSFTSFLFSGLYVIYFLSTMQFDSRISSASNLVQKLQKDTENSNLRGPYLAELEIEKRKFLFGKKNENKLLESLLQYFLKYVAVWSPLELILLFINKAY